MNKMLGGDWIEYSGKPSIRSRIIKIAIRSVMDQARNKSLNETRRLWDAQGRRARVPHDFEVEPASIAGVECEWILPKAPQGRRTIIYLHGGGYVLGSLNTARGFAMQVSRVTEEKVLSVGYRLAPENPFPAGLQDSLAVYRELLDQGNSAEDIILIGDSAGGGLSLATVLALKEQGEPMPCAVICLSPWTDLAATGDSITANAKLDPIFGKGGGLIKAEDYAGEESLYNPFVSPLYGDYTGFPPMLIHVGTDEIILDDSVRVAEKAREAGVKVSLKIWKGMWHVFAAQHNMLPEARQAFKEISDFVKSI